MSRKNAPNAAREEEEEEEEEEEVGDDVEEEVRYVRDRRDEEGDERGKNKKRGTRAYAVEIRPGWMWCMCKQYGLDLVDVAPKPTSLSARALSLSDGPGSGFRPRTGCLFSYR